MPYLIHGIHVAYRCMTSTWLLSLISTYFDGPCQILKLIQFIGPSRALMIISFLCEVFETHSPLYPTLSSPHTLPHAVSELRRLTLYLVHRIVVLCLMPNFLSLASSLHSLRAFCLASSYTQSHICIHPLDWAMSYSRWPQRHLYCEFSLAASRNFFYRRCIINVYLIKNRALEIRE